MIRATIDTSALLKMLYSSLLASIFVAVVFSTALLGAIRASDMRRAGRAVAATAYTVLAAVGLLLASGVIVYGLVLIARKS
jgi:Na+/H+-dicarboxylate symporter